MGPTQDPTGPIALPFPPSYDSSDLRRYSPSFLAAPHAVFSRAPLHAQRGAAVWRGGRPPGDLQGEE